MKFKEVKVGDKIINRENPGAIYYVGRKTKDLVAVSNMNNYKDCFHLTKRSIRKYDLITDESSH